MIAKHSQRILFITREYPWPAHTGALQYSAMLLRALAQYSSSLHMLCSQPHFGSNPSYIEGLSDVKIYQYQEEPIHWKRSLFTSLPQAALRKSAADGLSKLQQLLQQRWSLIVVDHIASGWAHPLLLQYRHQTQKIIYCTHNNEYLTRLSIATSDPIRAPLHILDAWRAWRTDAKMFAISDAVTCISSNDISTYCQHSFVNNMSLHLLSPIYANVPRRLRTITPEVSRTICLVGSFIWSAKKRNLLLFLQACATLFEQHGIQIKVIGNMRDEFRKTLQQHWPQVCFTGSVDDVIAHLDDARIAVIPEQAGGGFKLKSLEYVFQRLPIFALEQALVDLPLKHPYSVQLYPNLRDLAAGIVRHVDDEALLNNMQQRAFDACAAFSNTEAMIHSLEEMLNADRV